MVSFTSSSFRHYIHVLRIYDHFYSSTKLFTYFFFSLPLDGKQLQLIQDPFLFCSLHSDFPQCWIPASITSALTQFGNALILHHGILTAFSCSHKESTAISEFCPLMSLSGRNLKQHSFPKMKSRCTLRATVLGSVQAPASSKSQIDSRHSHLQLH